MSTINTNMQKLKLLNLTTVLAFTFIFAMTGLDVILSYMGWKPTFGDDLLAGTIGFLPSIGSVSLSMLIGITPSIKTKILASIIWLFCVTISLTGNFLNMTARAFDSLDTENIAKAEVVTIKDSNQAQISVYKDANKAQLELYDIEIAELTVLLNKARESRDFQINDGVNRDGSIGPKARAFQAEMDRVTVSIEQKRSQKRALQAESSAALLEFQKQSQDTLSQASVVLAETQNDMRGHMPVIRYFLPNKDHQRNAVLWGLGLFAAVISLAGPVVSYAMAVHLNHKRLLKKKLAREQAAAELIVESETAEETKPYDLYLDVVLDEAKKEAELVAKQQEEEEREVAKQVAIKKRKRRLKNSGYR
jgi:hypothetical protein